MSIIYYFLAFVVILSPVIFIHEFGHYIVARWCGVRVESFSIGFGPELFGWTDKHGTRWAFRAFFVGGGVQLAGEEPAETEKKDLTLVQGEGAVERAPEKGDTLDAKPIWQKISIAFAGPFANYIFSFLLFIGIFFFIGQRVLPPVISTVIAQGPAAKAGLTSGDRIISINQLPTMTYADVIDILSKTSMEDDLKIQYARGRILHDARVASPILAPEHRQKWLGNLGIKPKTVGETRKVGSLRESISLAWASIVGLTKQPIAILRAKNVEAFMGPIGIAKHAGKVFEEGTLGLLLFVASISVGLGFFNLLPIPIVDGGRIVLWFVEGVIGRPLSARVQNALAVVGLTILGSLLLLLSWQDINRTETFQKVRKLFGAQESKEPSAHGTSKPQDRKTETRSVDKSL